MTGQPERENTGVCSVGLGVVYRAALDTGIGRETRADTLQRTRRALAQRAAVDEPTTSGEAALQRLAPERDVGRGAEVLCEAELLVHERDPATRGVGRIAGRPLGAIEGYENTPDNSGLGWLPAETPIANLLLAGAWTNSGGQIPALTSGVQAARLALRTPSSAA